MEEEQAERSLGIDLTMHESPIQGLLEAPLLSLQKALDHACEGEAELQKTEWSSKITKALDFAAKKKKNRSAFVDLSDEEVAAIHLYTQETPLYAILNARLRAEEREGLKPFLPYVKLLLSALYKLPPVSALVYRGVKKDLSTEIAKGKAYIWWPFSSTTSSIETLQSEKFLGKKGKRSLFTLHIISGVDIKNFSAFGQTEKEILLLPGTCLVVESILNTGSGAHIYQLRETYVPGLLDFSRPARGSFPSRNRNFIGREKELYEMKEKLKGNPRERFSQLVLVGGGGMGKSSLALEYLHLHHPNHTFARWIPSDKKVAEELKEVGMSLGMVEQNTSPEEAAKMVLKHLNTKLSGWLLVYDNVESAEQIKDYLPDPRNSARGHLIITTRDQSLPKDPFFDPSFSSSSSSSVIHLAPLTSSEGVEVLLHYWQADDSNKKPKLEESEIAVARKISEELGDLPLALTQAGSFMKQKDLKPSTYLDMLRKERKELMKTQNRPRDYPFSVVTTWKMSVEKIKESSPESLRILFRSLFLHPDDIPQIVLSWEKEGSMGRLQWIKRIDPLLRYSLLSETKPGYFSIHRLTQYTLRDELSEEEREAAMDQVGLTLESEWKYDHTLPSSWPSSKELISHLEEYFSHERKNVRKARLLYGAAYYHSFLDVNLSKAERFLILSLELNQELNGQSDHADTAMCLFGLGRVYYLQQSLSRALDYHTRSLEMRKNIFGEEHPAVADSLNHLGNVYADQGEFQKAIDCYTRSLDLRRSHFGEEHPDVARSLNSLGTVYSDEKKLDKAIDYFSQALKIQRKIYGDEHPEVADTLNNFGLSLTSKRSLDQAIDSHTKALHIYRKIYGEEHPDVAMTLNNLGNAYAEKSLPKAIDYTTQALQLYIKIYGEESPDVAYSLNNLGFSFTTLGELTEAIEYLTRSLKIKKQIYGEEHPTVANTLLNLGAVHRQQGNLSDAIACFTQSHDVYLKKYGNEHPSTMNALSELQNAMEEGEKAAGKKKEPRNQEQGSHEPKEKRKAEAEEGDRKRARSQGKD